MNDLEILKILRNNQISFYKIDHRFVPSDDMGGTKELKEGVVVVVAEPKVVDGCNTAFSLHCWFVKDSQEGEIRILSLIEELKEATTFIGDNSPRESDLSNLDRAILTALQSNHVPLYRINPTEHGCMVSIAWPQQFATPAVSFHVDKEADILPMLQQSIDEINRTVDSFGTHFAIYYDNAAEMPPIDLMSE